MVGHSYVLRRKTAGNMIPNANRMCIVRIAKIKRLIKFLQFISFVVDIIDCVSN